MSLYFDNNKLFDAEGHLTDEGLYAIKDGTLDDLGALEAAEHLSFCDYCLLRYTAMIDAAPDCMKQPMRDLIPQVQSLMRLRSFRIMTNRYVSAAAAVVLGFVMWGAVSTFGVPNAAALLPQQPAVRQERFGTKFNTAVNGFYKSLDDTFKSFTLTAENGLDQIRAQSIGGSTAEALQGAEGQAHLVVLHHILGAAALAQLDGQKLVPAHQHFVHSRFIGIPFLTVAPVFVSDLPFLVRILLPLLKAFILLVFIYLQPEFAYHRTVFRPLGFHLVDLGIGPPPFILRCKAFDTFYHDPAVPGTVKNGDLSLFGKACPKTP